MAEKGTFSKAEKSALPAFQQYQYAFAAHIRDPKNASRPAGVEARRMNVYAELLYNNIESFMLACFPVLHKVLGKRKWTRLIRAFFVEHRSHTPFFRQIPDEFIQFLQSEWQPDPAYPDFMLELAHYEWIELVLSVSNREINEAEFEREGDLLAGMPVLNPVMSVLRYAYPVHRIGPRFKPGPDGRDDTHLLVFRDASGKVKFSVINPVTARLLSLLEDQQARGRDVLNRLGEELQHPDPRALIEFGSELLRDLRDQGAILGSKMPVAD